MKRTFANLFFAFFMAACCSAPPQKEGAGTGAGPAPAGPAQPAQHVEIKTLLSEYKDNEVRADGAYKGKVIEVSGKAGDIKKDVLNKIYITVGTGQTLEIPVVQCMVSDAQTAKASALSKGTAVTVKGKVKGKMMNVILEDCEIQ